jgi:hypothetical protein
MSRLGLGFTVMSVVTVAFAGCVATEPEKTIPEKTTLGGHGAMVHGMAPPMGEFTMEATDCEEGGFVAAYPMSEGANHVGVWYLEDIRAEIGNPLRTGIGTPVTGPLDGNWHQGYKCKTATVNGETQEDYIFGYIANMIKPPEFDPGGADVHFIIAGLGFGNGSFADQLRESTTADITHAYNAQVDWYVPKESPRSFVYVEFSDVEKGIYMSASEMAYYRDVSPRTIRIWWQVPADGSDSHMGHAHGGSQGGDESILWNPVYWDITTTGGAQYTTPPIDSLELACHRGIDDHGPQGGLCQPTLTNIYQHKSLTFTAGKLLPEIVIEGIWSH